MDPTRRKIRVLFYLFFPASGIARYTHELVRSLDDYDDMEIKLVCPPNFEFREAATYDCWPKLRQLQHPTPWRRRLRFLIAQVVNPRRLGQQNAAWKPDIIHFSNINHLTYPMWRGGVRAGNARIVATAHDVRRAGAMINRSYEDHQLRRFYRDADALFVHGESQRRELQDFSNVASERITVVPHGYYEHGTESAGRDELRRRYAVPSGQAIALAFGNLRDDKNVDLLIKSIATAGPNTYLIVAGRAGGTGHRPFESYRKLAEDAGIGDRVQFLNRYIPDQEVADLFTVCDWVALTYGSRFTSQSGVLNVAANYRRPVVASAVGTLAETIRRVDVGVLVEPDDELSLVQGIQEIERRLRDRHRHYFEEYLKLYSWAETARITRDRYIALTRGGEVTSQTPLEVRGSAESH